MQLTDPILHPVALACILDRKVPGWLDMDASVLRKKVAEVGPCSLENWTKIQAAKTVLTTARAFDDFRVFTFVVEGLNGKIPNFSTLEPPEIPELVGGAQIMMLLRLHSPIAFSSEVIRYASVVSDMRQAGALPEPLEQTKEFVTIPPRDPDIAKDARLYVASLNKSLVGQMEALGE